MTSLFRICAALIPSTFTLIADGTLPFVYIFNQNIAVMLHPEGVALASARLCECLTVAPVVADLIQGMQKKS
jgi:hypothetical protein